MKSSLRLALLVLVLAPVAFFVFPQTAPAGEKAIVGAPSNGTRAWEFLGRSDQSGPDVTHYGYLTHIFGVADHLLFSDPNTRTEATARFTFLATTTLTSRHELGNIIATVAPGTLIIYFTDTPGSDFNDPTSFASGQPIAAFSVRYHNVLNVQAPNQGISSATADLLQLNADSFTLDGRWHRLGHRGLRERVWTTGQGTRTQVFPPRAFFLLGGNVVVTGR
jgi:hypothetical protein